SRKPAAFRLDDPRVVIAPPPQDGAKPRAPRGAVRVMPEPEYADITVPAQAPVPVAPRRFAWGTVFWSALGGLVLLGLGLATVNLIQDLYARVAWLGAFGAALAALAALAFLVICCREVIGLARLSSLEKTRGRGA